MFFESFDILTSLTVKFNSLLTVFSIGINLVYVTQAATDEPGEKINSMCDNVKFRKSILSANSMGANERITRRCMRHHCVKFRKLLSVYQAKILSIQILKHPDIKVFS